MNEYDYWKQLNSMSIQELSRLNISKEDIKYIKEFSFAEKIKERAKLDDKTLKNMHYTDEQIEMLRNFSGTEAEMSVLSASVSMNHFVHYYYYDSSVNETYAKIGFSWNWSSQPLTSGMTDALAGTWQNLYLDDNYGYDTYSTVRYQLNSGSDLTYYDAPIDGDPLNFTSEFPFALDDYTYAWSYSGYGSVKLVGSGQVAMLPIRIAYAHTFLTLSPSVSFDGMGGIGFGWGTTNAGSDYAVYRLADYN